ncbi:patatin [candidate division KSB1 bacterium]|nr:MAG: patatin [candidate division KSB1 bacterium]
MKSSKIKVGLALGGGGARGLAHIGVVKVLIQAGIPIHCIAGTSMGAIVGGAFALSGDINSIERRARELPQKVPEIEQLSSLKSLSKDQRPAVKRLFGFIKEIYLLNMGMRKKWLIDCKDVFPLLEEVLDSKSFTDLKLPFAAVATDLQTGEELVLTDGPLMPAVFASMAIPGIFEPVVKDDRLLVDGGVTSLVPVDAVKQLGANFVIAVNVEAGVFRRDFQRGIDILFQVDDIRGSELNRLKLAQADVVITPEIRHINWAQFSKVQECIHRGEEAARQKLPEIQEKLAAKRRKLFWNRFIPFRMTA